MSYAIGVDIGGTFSDCVAIDDAGRVHHGKAPSTHGSTPVEGVLAGLERLAESTGETVDTLLQETTRFSHGTTIGTNLIVERKGARVGVIATKGHGDALLMMRGRGRTAGEPADRVLNVRDTDKPRPLVPRRHIAEVIERVAVDGSILVALDEDAARAAVADLLEEGVEAISVALLWSFRNPVHELRIRDLVHELAPDMYVSLSCETAPRQGEFERTVATVINSYIGPASSRYLDDLLSTLKARGLGRAPFIMQANGGVAPAVTASRQPVQTIGSGPAGGLAGTAEIARRSGHENVIATDMGGTSFEVGLLVHGRPVLSSENVIDKYTFKVSHLDVRSIACGGGSIAHVDPRTGALQVGPASAGSQPGPACYGNDGPATVTDADVILGLIEPDGFLAGTMALDAEASAAKVGALAEQTGLSLEAAAAGILRINANNAATLVRQRTIEQGLDPRDFVLYAFGGAGPVHAFSFGAELGVNSVVIPMGDGASTLSAYGIAAGDATQLFERECSLMAPFDGGELAGIATALEDQALAEMRDAGFGAESVSFERSALARYAGQYNQELVLAMSGDASSLGTTVGVAFEDEYARLYGRAAMSPFHLPEVFAVRIMASVPATARRADDGAPSDAGMSPASSRDVFWPGGSERVPTSVFKGAPPAGTQVGGPAIVQLPHTTISVAPAQTLSTDASGDCHLRLESAT